MVEILNPNIEILNKFEFSKGGKFKTISPQGVLRKRFP
jgi:hypothetical protein